MPQSSTPSRHVRESCELGSITGPPCIDLYCYERGRIAGRDDCATQTGPFFTTVATAWPSRHLAVATPGRRDTWPSRHLA